MELKPGYKETDVGVIPDDWDVKKLSEIAIFLDGQRRPIKASDRAKIQGDIPYYGASGIVDYVNDYIFDEELILLGEDGENILSRNLPLAFRVSGKTWVNNHAHVLRPNSDISIGFLCEYLESLDYSDLNSGTAQPKLNKQKCLAISVALPPLPEQRAIATALSDTDALLDGLDRLITKKRDIKQAAMQQLLTGETRLPVFEGEWVTKRAGDIGQFRGGSGFPTRFQGEVSGTYPFFKVSDMNNDGNDTFMVSANNYINEAVRKQIGSAVFPAQTIVFAKVGAAVFLERKKILIKPSCIDNNMAGYISDASQVDVRFIHYVLLRKKLGELVSTTALPSLSGNVLAAIEFFLPPLGEQEAIATVLSDMDAEIAALELRRAKTKDIKQAMMQELLTGKTRLVTPGGSNV